MDLLAACPTFEPFCRVCAGVCFVCLFVGLFVCLFALLACVRCALLTRKCTVALHSLSLPRSTQQPRPRSSRVRSDLAARLARAAVAAAEAHAVHARRRASQRCAVLAR